MGDIRNWAQSRHRINNMKNFYLALTLGILLSVSSCEKPEVKNIEVNAPANIVPQQNSQEPHAASTQPKDGNYPGKGKVTKINTDLGSVELDHQEVVGVMPAMIMEFYVKDKSVLGDIKVGDEVDFILEYKHPTETIVSIKKIK